MNSFSRIGFILAAAGSAVGLGNIWKFPYITGQYGGGAFVLVYLLTVFFIGFPLLIAEIAVGSYTKKDAVASFEELAPVGKKGWKWAGLSIWSGFLILTFYSAVIGWIFYYVFISITQLPSNAESAEKIFMGLLTEDPVTQIICHALAMICIVYIVLNGVTKGIQRANKILMPILITILLIMFFYSLSLESIGKSLSFMFQPDFSKLSSNAVLIAVGHAFFTLSIGMGSIFTYAAYSDKKFPIINSALWIVFLDTIIALVAGISMFAILYSVGSEPGAGPGLVFISLPLAFYKLGAFGQILSVLFFIALAFAGMTSAISILEPTVSYLEKSKKIPRIQAILTLCTFAFLIGVLTILSNVKGFDWLVFGGVAFFDVIDIFTSAISLPLGGLLLAIFIGYVMKQDTVKKYLQENGMQEGFWNYWINSLKYIVPLGVGITLISEVYDKIIKKIIG